MKTRIGLDAFPAAGQFLRVYRDAEQYARVAPWFHYNPHDPQCFAQRVAELDARTLAGQAAVPVAMTGLAEPPVPPDRQGRLSHRAYSVVTGQQVGLFGGPLYSQLKAVSAVKLARQLAMQFPQHSFAPVFWMATNDSDFDEVRTAKLLNRAGDVREVALPPNGTQWGGQLVGARDVSEHLPHALGQLETELPGGEYRDEVLAAIREDYATDNLATGFARWMTRLFKGTGLVICDPAQPELRAAIGPFVERELADPVRFEVALNARNSEIAAVGFSVQAEHIADDTSFFMLDEDLRREKVVRDGDGYALRPSGRRYSGEELLAITRESPQCFVPGAMLMPAYQDALLAPVAFIGGGAELAYRAQATTLFDLHGAKMAPAFFRASATLLPEKSAALLAELGWEVADLYGPPQDLARRAVEHDRPAELSSALAAYLDTLHSADDRLRAAALALDPTLEESFETLRGNLIRHVEKLDKKVTASLKHRAEARLRKVEQAGNQVYPQGQVQERELSLLSFLPRYGFGLVPRLIDELEFPCWEHQVAVL